MARKIRRYKAEKKSAKKKAKASKKDSGSKIVMVTLIISWLIIGFGVWYVFFKNPKTPLMKTDSSVEKTQQKEIKKENGGLKNYVGEKIITKGEMKPTETYTLFTHYFTNDKGDKFGLKSKTINLYDFKGKVSLKGEVKDFKGDLPIISVTEILNKSGTRDTTGFANDQYFGLKDAAIGFDLSVSEGYSVVTEEGKLLLMDTSGEIAVEVLQVSPFTCKPGSSLEDCAVLKKTVSYKENDSFVSGQGITFYHLSETTTWLAFQDNINYGYYLYPADEYKFAAFANLLSFNSKQKIEAVIQEEVKNICKDIDHTMNVVSNFSYDWKQQGLVKVTLTGQDKGIDMTCVLGVKLGNSLKIKKLSFSTSDNKEETKKVEKIKETKKVEKLEEVKKVEKIEEVKKVEKLEEAKKAEKLEEAKKAEKLEEAKKAEKLEEAKKAEKLEEAKKAEKLEEEKVVKEKPAPVIEKASITPPAAKELPNTIETGTGSTWFTYNSVRGYKVHFSNKNISYAGQLLGTPTNLGIEGMHCSYKINVATRGNKAKVNTNPSLSIYECKGVVDAASLSKNKVQNVGTVDGVVFLTKRYGNPWGNMNISVRK